MSHDLVYAGMEFLRGLSSYAKLLQAKLPQFPGEFLELCHVVADECGRVKATNRPPGGTLVATRMVAAHLERLQRNDPTRWRPGSGQRCENVEEFVLFLGEATEVIRAMLTANGRMDFAEPLIPLYLQIHEFFDKMRQSNPRPFVAREAIKPLREACMVLPIVPQQQQIPTAEYRLAAVDSEMTLHESDLQAEVEREIAREMEAQGRPKIHISGIRAENIRHGPPLPPSMQRCPDLVGKTLGKYEIEHLIGTGASSHVYRSTHPQLKFPVAVKVLLLPHDKSSEERVDQFFREARLSVQLNHPNAVRIFDLDEARNHHFIVMEYVEGATVRELIAETGRFEERRTLEIAARVVDVLDAAYQQRIIHRDIKPQNIIITREGEVKVSDLGLAKIATFEDVEASAGIAGTPSYMAPEAIQNPGRVDFRVDIYSLGATIYHMLTGATPFEGLTIHEQFDAHLNHFLPDPRKKCPTLTPGTAGLIMHMMEKRPEKRHVSYPALREEIASLLELHARGGKSRNFTTGIVSKFRGLLGRP